MDNSARQSVSDAFHSELETLACQDGPRVQRVEVEGRVFWIKRVEQLGLRYRLQKGDPRKAFERERAAYLHMNAAQAPVPKMVAHGDSFLVLPDCGRDLRHRFKTEGTEDDRIALLHAASAALGAFHRLGFAHGRPSPKDMCLVDGEVLLLDFERYSPDHNTATRQALDLVVFAYEVAAYSPNMRDGLRGAMAAYRAESSEEIWQLACQWCRRMRWANWVTKPLQMRKGEKSREFKAIPVVLDLFLSDDGSLT